MQNYDTEEQGRLRKQIESLPPHLRGSLSAIIQYKFLRDQLNKTLSVIITNITPPLVPAMQGLASALLYFADALSENLGTYHAVWGINKALVLGVLQSQDPAQIWDKVDSIIKGVFMALSKCKSLKAKSDELVNAMDAFQRKLIEITGNINTEQLEKDVRAAYAEAEEHLMKSTKHQRDLAIAKATLAQLNDTSKSEEEIKRNLEQRLKMELDSASKAQAELTTAVAKDRKLVEKHSYWGAWWLFGPKYSYTSIIDTSSEQSAALSKIRMADARIQEITTKISTTSYNRKKLRETAEADASQYEIQSKEEAASAEEKFQLARQLEHQLNEARLSAAGCSQQTKKAITAAFDIAFPLFQRLAESVSMIAAQHDTMKAMVSQQKHLGLIELILITDELMKLAVLGEYSCFNSFSIGTDPTIQLIESARNQQLQKMVISIQSAPVVDPGKTTAVKCLVAPEASVQLENTTFKVPDISAL